MVNGSVRPPSGARPPDYIQPAWLPSSNFVSFEQFSDFFLLRVIFRLVMLYSSLLA